MYLIRKNFNIAQNDMISTYGLSMTQLGMIGLGFSITYGVGKTVFPTTRTAKTPSSSCRLC
jgi:OPA family hexose phosphate transport protein UhpT-like MFS transporter